MKAKPRPLTEGDIREPIRCGDMMYREVDVLSALAGLKEDLYHQFKLFNCGLSGGFDLEEIIDKWFQLKDDK